MRLSCSGSRCSPSAGQPMPSGWGSGRGSCARCWLAPTPASSPASRCQPLDPPALAVGEVAEAVVQAVAAVLPELVHPGRQPVAAPALGERQLLLAVARFELGHPRLQHLPALDHLALG